MPSFRVVLANGLEIRLRNDPSNNLVFFSWGRGNARIALHATFIHCELWGCKLDPAALPYLRMALCAAVRKWGNPLRLEMLRVLFFSEKDTLVSFLQTFPLKVRWRDKERMLEMPYASFLDLASRNCGEVMPGVPPPPLLALLLRYFRWHCPSPPPGLPEDLLEQLRLPPAFSPPGINQIRRCRLES